MFSNCEAAIAAQLVVAQLKSTESVLVECCTVQDIAPQPAIVDVTAFQGDLGEVVVAGENGLEHVDLHTIGAVKCEPNQTKAMQVVAVRQPVKDAGLERTPAMATNQVQVSNGVIALQAIPKPGSGSKIRQIKAISEREN